MRFKETIITGILTAIVGFTPMVAAQVVSDSPSKQENAVERVEKESGGNIEILMSPEMLDFLLTPPAAPQRQVERRKGPVLQKGINKVRGFRVQVFSDGRNQSTLEARVKTRANAISARFPKYRGQVYTFSSAPNWYCRVGNFQTQKEAAAALAELKRAFPAFAGEMRIVNSEVVIVR